MDEELNLVIGILLLCVIFIVCTFVAMGNSYDEYYNECIQEQVLSNFECKQAAHNMAYGD